MPKCKTYNKAIVMEAMWYCFQNRQIGYWSRMESYEIITHLYRQLLFDRVAKSDQWRKNIIFSILVIHI